MIKDSDLMYPDPRPSSEADADLEKEVNEALGGQSVEDLMAQSEQPTADSAGGGSAADAADTATGEAGAKPAGDPNADQDQDQFNYELVRGRISQVSDEDVFVEVTGILGKNQGVVPLRQFEHPPRPGSIMDFLVERYDNDEGLLILNREGAVTKASWDQMHRGSTVEAHCVGTNKGGLELELAGGIKAFMPASQIDLQRVEDLEGCVGQKFVAKVTEVDRRKKRVLISRRSHLEAERRAKREATLKELEVGQTREGQVSRIMPFGAFVDIGGVDGLVHVSDISHTRVDRPESVLSEGQPVTVKVLKLDLANDRISLGLKQAQPDPWDAMADTLRAGQQVTGRVVRLAKFGAFIELQPGIEGLLPISEMSWRRIGNPSELLSEGQEVRLVVLDINPEKRRLSFSLKQVDGDPWVGAESRFPVNAVLEGTVVGIQDFGAFVELATGIEGMVHISELADRRVGAVGDVVKIGDRREFRVLECDEEKRRIALSIKRLKEPVEETSSADQQRQQDDARKRVARRKVAGNLKGGMGDNGALGTGLGGLKL